MWDAFTSAFAALFGAVMDEPWLFLVLIAVGVAVNVAVWFWLDPEKRDG